MDTGSETEPDAVVIVDHGSRRPAAARGLDEIVRLVREQRPDLWVEAAHLELAEPGVGAAIARCAEAGARCVVVVPYFLAAGRHVLEDLPRQVEAACADHPGLRARVAPPLGPDVALARLVIERAGVSGKGSGPGSR